MEEDEVRKGWIGRKVGGEGNEKGKTQRKGIKEWRR